MPPMWLCWVRCQCSERAEPGCWPREPATEAWDLLQWGVMWTCVFSNTDLVCALSDLNRHLCHVYDLEDAVSFTDSARLWLTLANSDQLWHPLPNSGQSGWFWMTLVDFEWLWLPLPYSDWIWRTLADPGRLWLTLADSVQIWLTLGVGLNLGDSG